MAFQKTNVFLRSTGLGVALDRSADSQPLKEPRFVAASEPLVKKRANLSIFANIEPSLQFRRLIFHDQACAVRSSKGRRRNKFTH